MGRIGAKQRLHRGDFVLAALAQGGLIDVTRELVAHWRAFTAPG